MTIDRARRRTQLFFLACAAVVAAVALVPVVYLIVRSSSAGLGAALEIAQSSSSVKLMARSLALALAVSASALVLGAVLSWWTVAEDLPLRRVLSVAVIVPLAVPCYVAASAWIASTSYGGSVRGVFGLIGLGTPSRPEGFVWSWIILTCFTYPYALLPMRASMRRLDACQYESARSTGASRRGAVWSALLPQLTPAAVTGVVLVMLYTLAEFGAVTLFGLDTFTRVIYQQYQSSFDRSSAAMTSVMLLGVIVVVIVCSEWFTRRGKDACCASGCEDSLDIRLGRGRWFAFGAIVLFALATSGFVVIELMRWALRGAEFDSAGVLWIAAITSAVLALVGAVVTVFASYPAAWIAVRMRGVLSSVLERVTHFGFGLPGIVVALGLAAVALGLPELGMYQSWVLIVVAYVVLFLPQSSGAIRSSLNGTPRSLEDAAISLGARGGTVFGRVTLPMIRPGIFAGGTLVFLSAMKELPATLLLAPPDVHTLSTRVWGYMEESMYAQAALPALGLIAVSSIVVALVSVAEREKRSPILAGATLGGGCACEKPDCAECGRRRAATQNDTPVVSLTVSGAEAS